MNVIADVVTELAETIGPRPVGSEGNNEAVNLIAGIASSQGYDIEKSLFTCLDWRPHESIITIAGNSYQVHAGPYSAPVRGSFPVETASSLEELRGITTSGSLLVLHGELASEPIMPKNFPFYFPDRDRDLIEHIEKLAPAVVLALTGKHPLCGLDPFPLFEDGRISFPSAYGDASGPLAAAIDEAGQGGTAEVELVSDVRETDGRQIYCSRKGRETRPIIVTAHIDTKPNTPGALDNAGGVAVLTAVMERLKSSPVAPLIEYVPFNGEECYDIPGQRIYLSRRSPSPENTRLVINIDGVGYNGMPSEFSSYNIVPGVRERLNKILNGHRNVSLGEPWIAGDHTMFAMAGIPSVAVTGACGKETLMRLSHTERDTIEHLDFAVLNDTAGCIAALLEEMGENILKSGELAGPPERIA